MQASKTLFAIDKNIDTFSVVIPFIREILEGF